MSHEGFPKKNIDPEKKALLEKTAQEAEAREKAAELAEKAVSPAAPTPETTPPSFSKPPASPTLETTPLSFSAEKLNAKLSVEKAEKQAERLGFEDQPDLRQLVAKGAMDTLGSVFGIRLGWELPKLALDHLKKKAQRGNISDSTIALLESAQARKNPGKYQKYQPSPEEMKKAEEMMTPKEFKPVVTKIKALNERLQEAKMPAQEKLALRKEMAEILKSYRNKDGKLEEDRTEKVGKLLDLYINNSAQGMVVAREAVNTVSIMTMMPWLRTIGYTAFAGAERAVKAGNNYDKAHFRDGGSKAEKVGFLAKNLTVDAAKETYNGLIGNFFNKEVGKAKTITEFISGMGKLLRVVGIVGFEHALQSGTLAMQEGGQKFWESVDKGNFGEALEQGYENWLNNTQRIFSHIRLAENPDDAVRYLNGNKEAMATAAIHKEAIEKIQLGKTAENLEKMKELATIRKGEGIIHGLLRQLENDPAARGYTGDLNNQVAVHRWAQHEAYALAVKNNFIDSKTGAEVRVFDSKDPSVYLLKQDNTVEVFKRNEYRWNPAQETAKVLQESATLHKAEEINMKLKLATDRMVEEGAIRGVFEVQSPLASLEKNQLTSHGWNEWNEMKHRLAENVMKKDYGEHVGKSLDWAEERHQQKLYEYITKLQKDTNLAIDKNETVGHYITRANRALAEANLKPEERQVLEGIAKAVAVKEVVVKEVDLHEAARIAKKIGSTHEAFTVDRTKVSFTMGPDNKIEFKHEGSLNYLGGRKMLKYDYMKYIVENPKLGEYNIAQDEMLTKTSEIVFMRKVLNKLNAQGRGDGVEAKFLHDSIKKIVKGLGKYGEIFKEGTVEKYGK